MFILVPGGVNGVALQLNSPNIYAQADSLGFTLADLSKFNVKISWGVSLSHSTSGKS